MSSHTSAEWPSIPSGVFLLDTSLSPPKMITEAGATAADSGQELTPIILTFQKSSLSYDDMVPLDILQATSNANPFITTLESVRYGAYNPGYLYNANKVGFLPQPQHQGFLPNLPPQQLQAYFPRPVSKTPAEFDNAIFASVDSVMRPELRVLGSPAQFTKESATLETMRLKQMLHKVSGQRKQSPPQINGVPRSQDPNHWATDFGLDDITFDNFAELAVGPDRQLQLPPMPLPGFAPAPSVYAPDQQHLQPRPQAQPVRPASTTHMFNDFSNAPSNTLSRLFPNLTPPQPAQHQVPSQSQQLFRHSQGSPQLSAPGVNKHTHYTLSPRQLPNTDSSPTHGPTLNERCGRVTNWFSTHFPSSLHMAPPHTQPSPAGSIHLSGLRHPAWGTPNVYDITNPSPIRPAITTRGFGPGALSSFLSGVQNNMSGSNRYAAFAPYTKQAQRQQQGQVQTKSRPLPRTQPTPTPAARMQPVVHPRTTREGKKRKFDIFKDANAHSDTPSSASEDEEEEDEAVAEGSAEVSSPLTPDEDSDDDYRPSNPRKKVKTHVNDAEGVARRSTRNATRRC